MEIKIVRSKNRTKTISARAVDGVFVVQAPARMSDGDLEPVIHQLMQRWQKREQKKGLDDGSLERRAQELNRSYFGGRLRWQSIRWVANQNTRFGSCTPTQGTIRISHKVARMPAFVRDYVIVHELAHLLVPSHDARFVALMDRFLPHWRHARDILNRFPVRHEAWEV